MSYYQAPDGPRITDLRADTVAERFGEHISAMLDAIDGKPGSIGGRMVRAKSVSWGRMVNIYVSLDAPGKDHPLNVMFNCFKSADSGYTVEWIGPWDSVGKLRFDGARQRIRKSS